MSKYKSKKEKENNLILNAIIMLLVVTIGLVLLVNHASKNPMTQEQLNNIANQHFPVDEEEHDINEEIQDVKDQAIGNMLDSLGKSEDDINKNYDENGNIIGDSVKTVTNFRTLNDAEVYMGYYLGLHNTLESLDGYELVSVMAIGDNDWVHAIYQGDHSEHTDSGDKMDFSLKVSKETPLEIMLAAFDLDSYEIQRLDDIYGVEVTILGKYKADGFLNLAFFETKNNKKYVINSGAGLKEEYMITILEELVGNLKSMDDWIW